MSTYTSEPGTRLAGRYRLVDQVGAGAGWTYWKATDETLARFVTVLTFAAGFPRVAETVTAARAASRLGDPRFSQVFDVEDADELAYVVLEWVVGESLLDMLSEGPLDPPRAAALMVEAARAIANAHDGGLAHLRLDPACLHWTPGGGVKIAGLGIDAALVGPDLTAAEDGADDPELIDTRDLARLLYAALTGYWPGYRGSVHAAPGVRGRPGRHRRRDLPGTVPAAEPPRPGTQHRGDVRRRPDQRGSADAAAGGHAIRPDRDSRLRLQDGRIRPPVPAGHVTADHDRRRTQAARQALLRRPRRHQRRDRARPGGGRRGRLVVQPQPASLVGGPAAGESAFVVARRSCDRPAQAGQCDQLQ